MRNVALGLCLGCLVANGAHAQVDVIVNTLGSCPSEPGGIGASIGNVGSQDVLQDTGFAFTVPPGLGGAVTDITVCVSASNETAGDDTYVAPFALYSDANGAPYEPIDEFAVTLTETRGYSQALSERGAMILPGRTYWLVAQRSVERGAWWRAIPDQIGLRATLEADAVAWTVDERAISQMRLRALPEPSSAVAAALTLAALRSLRGGSPRA